MFVIAVVNEQSVFKPLKVYCTSGRVKLKLSSILSLDLPFMVLGLRNFCPVFTSSSVSQKLYGQEPCYLCLAYILKIKLKSTINTVFIYF